MFIDNTFVPYVKDANGVSDVFSHLLSKRIIFLNGEINDTSASLTVAKILYLNNINNNEEIALMIDSGGGSVTSGLSIYDVIKYVDAPVATICVGLAASMAGIILCAGRQGRRRILKHAKVMLHQPLYHFTDTRLRQTEMDIYSRELALTRKILENIICENTKIPSERVSSVIHEDKYFSATESLEAGIVDVLV